MQAPPKHYKELSTKVNDAIRKFRKELQEEGKDVAEMKITFTPNQDMEKTLHFEVTTCRAEIPLSMELKPTSSRRGSPQSN